MKLDKYSSLRDMIATLVPDYRGRGWRPFCVQFPWNKSDANFMWTVSRKRCSNRVASYVDDREVERSKESIRFGVAKTGQGYRGQRGDFCLVGGVLVKGELSLFYRRLELLGGLHFDLAVIDHIEDLKGPLRKISIFAVEAKVFALRGNSNEKLYSKLREHYRMNDNA